MSETLEGQVIVAADVPVYATSIVAFSKTAKLLAELEATYKDKTYEVTTTAGMDEARGARRKIREVRYALEAFRKQEKADIVARGKAIDTDAKYLEEHLVAIEDPIHQQIKAEEDRKEKEKAERERVEKLRVDAIRAKINAMKQLALDNVGQPSSMLEIAIDLCRSEVIDKEVYAEFAVEADMAKSDTLAALLKMQGAAELIEKQQAELAEQKAALDRQAAEQREEAARQRAEKKALDAQAEAQKPKTEPPVVAQLTPQAVPASAALVEAIDREAVIASLPWLIVGRDSTVVRSADGLTIADCCSKHHAEFIVSSVNEVNSQRIWLNQQIKRSQPS